MNFLNSSLLRTYPTMFILLDLQETKAESAAERVYLQSPEQGDGASTKARDLNIYRITSQAAGWPEVQEAVTGEGVTSLILHRWNQASGSHFP